MRSFFIVSMVLLLGACSNAFGGKMLDLTDRGQTGVFVDRILTQVQDALIAVNDEIENDESGKFTDFPAMNNVTLNLTTVSARGAGGGLNIYVVSFGGKISKERTQTLTLKLTPPEKGESRASNKDVSASLADAILAAADGVQKARNRKPPLQLKELKTSVKFVVMKSGEGGVEFEIAPVGVELGGNVSGANTHEIVLEFK